MSSSCLASGHGDTQDGVGSQLALVVSAIELQHQIVDSALSETKAIRNFKWQKIFPIKIEFLIKKMIHGQQQQP